MQQPLNRAKVLVFDLEIRNAVPMRPEPRIDGIDYCNGWNDKAGMDVACCNVMWQRNVLPPMVFLRDNLPALQQYVNEADRIVSFNGVSFDGPVLAAWPHLAEGAPPISIPIEKHCDLLRLAQAELGYRPKLDDLCKANLPGVTKSDSGAMAPINWQRKRIGHVISYCFHDVWMTLLLYEYACQHVLRGPKGEAIDLRDTLNVSFQSGLFQ